MKKSVLFITLLCSAALILSACGEKSKPVPSSEPQTPAATTSAAPTASAAPKATAEKPAPTEDPRDAEPVVRAEISKMLTDIQDLIDEGLREDALMALRDLESRDLTPDEKKQVNQLKAKANKIKE